MAKSLRALAGMMTLTTMLSPSATIVWRVIHRALDAHHHEPGAATDDGHRDAAAALHGHRHDDGTPDHNHDATIAETSNRVPLPAPTTHPSVTDSASTVPATDLGFHLRTEPSPPQRVPVILRI